MIKSSIAQQYSRLNAALLYLHYALLLISLLTLFTSLTISPIILLSNQRTQGEYKMTTKEQVIAKFKNLTEGDNVANFKTVYGELVVADKTGFSLELHDQDEYAMTAMLLKGNSIIASSYK